MTFSTNSKMTKSQATRFFPRSLQLLLLGLVLMMGLLLPRQPASAADRSFNLSFTQKNQISTVASNAATLGTRDFYKFQAKEGQTTSIAIAAFENNGVFELQYQPQKSWSSVPNATGRAWSGRLPKSTGNQYRIQVGSTRGNAGYDLFVGIAAIEAGGDGRGR